jgi:hypothetical protein
MKTRNVRGLHLHESNHEGHFSQIFGVASKQASIDLARPAHPVKQKIHLRGCCHVDIEEVMEEASKADWSEIRERHRFNTGLDYESISDGCFMVATL